MVLAQCPWGYGLALAYAVNQYRRDHGDDEMACFDEMVRTSEHIPGLPKYMFAMASDANDDDRIAKAVRDSLIYLDDNRDRISYTDQHMWSVVLPRYEIVRDRIDLEQLGLSDESHESLMMIIRLREHRQPAKP